MWKMSLLLILHIANLIIPSLGDLRNVNISGTSTGWGEDIAAIWWPLLRIVFKKAQTVQVVRLPPSATLGTSLWAELIPNLHLRLSKAVTVWNASSGKLAQDYVNHGDDEARYFLLVTGSEFLHKLTDFHVWFNRCNYVVLVENSGKCSTSFDFVFRRKVYLVPHIIFVLSACPEFAYIVEPDVPNSSVMLNVTNVTAAVSLWDKNIPEFQNSTWRVTMFDRYPTSVQINGSKQKWTDFEGIDGFFLETISDYYNVKPIFVFPEDNQTYGAYENNTATGTLGIVVRGEADIALNGRFLIDYGTNQVDFTTPYLTDKLCIMAPRSKRIPSYIAMFRCFDKPAWMLLLLVYVVGSCVWSILHRGFDDKNRSRCTPQASRDVYFMILAGVVSSSTPQSPAARVFIASCLIFNVVFMGAFQGLLYKSMTSPTYYPEMNTLEDVDLSGLSVLTSSVSLKDAFPADDEDPLIQRLRSKVFVIRDEAVWLKIRQDEFGYTRLWRKSGAYLRLRLYNLTRLHLVEECPRSYFLSFVLQKRSPFLEIVNSFITRCNEHGLLQLWKERTYKATAEELRYMQEIDRDLTVKLRQVQTPFFILCIGLVVSVLAFFYENAAQRRKRKLERIAGPPVR